MKRLAAIKKILTISLGLIVAPLRVFLNKNCRTQSDVEGPFYRRGAPLRVDLTLGYKSTAPELMVIGKVYGKDCTTGLANATIDIWHASPDGLYDNESKNFRFRGKTRTDANGNYEFKTLLPGTYQSRPRHIHYKVRHSSFTELTTQLYFKNDARLKKDRAVIASNGEDRAMELKKSGKGFQVIFDIYLS